MAVPGPDSKKNLDRGHASPTEYKKRHIERWVQPQLWKPSSHNWSVGKASTEVAKIVRSALSLKRPY